MHPTSSLSKEEIGSKVDQKLYRVAAAGIEVGIGALTHSHSHLTRLLFSLAHSEESEREFASWFYLAYYWLCFCPGSATGQAHKFNDFFFTVEDFVFAV
ncbi:hypothetical protein P8452_66166 [Trifolium repens]|nr:hypothetical protein P8452_66166 [Trifolium repens]